MPAFEFHELRAGGVDSEHRVSAASPQKIASEFELLLSILFPGELQNYLSEVEALTAYDVANAHAAMVLRLGCWPNEYNSARAASAVAFEVALLAIFNASATVHGLKSSVRAQYRQMLHGMHVARIFGSRESYDVAFTRELVLECIDNASNWTRIWP